MTRDESCRAVRSSAFSIALIVGVGGPLLGEEFEGKSKLPSNQVVGSHVDPGRADPRAWCMRHSVERQFSQAIEDCGEAIRLDPIDAEPYSNRGAARLMIGEPDAAILDFVEALRLNPEDFRHHYNLALAFDTKGEFSLAIIEYSQAIRLNPQFASAYYNRALDMMVSGQRDMAISDLRSALALAPDFSAKVSKQLRKLGANP